MIGIFLSHELSGTYQCAKLAADMANVDNVRFVDSSTVCLGEALLVHLAAKLRDEGRTADQIVDALETAKQHLHLVAAIDNLKYLRKGGRLPAVAGGMLGIKPLICVQDGKVVLAGKARGLPGAYVALFKKIDEMGGIHPDFAPMAGYTVSPREIQPIQNYLCENLGVNDPMVRQIGCGTQRVEEQLQNLLPGVGVLRMDADTVSAVNTHEKLFRRFREERIPILLGTQMVAKGLDFENVTLSAVLDADLSLYASDYRAAETTFSLIAQVAGRAGRGKLGGRAILQTMTPQNQTIRFAAEQNYDAFFEAELPLRQLRGCPPYRDLLTVTFHGREEERVWQAALAFRARLDGLLHSEFYRGETAAVLGPAPASVARINYHYRCRLTLSCVNTRRLRELLAFLVREFAKDRSFRGVGAFVDVNGRE